MKKIVLMITVLLLFAVSVNSAPPIDVGSPYQTEVSQMINPVVNSQVISFCQRTDMVIASEISYLTVNSEVLICPMIKNSRLINTKQISYLVSIRCCYKDKIPISIPASEYNITSDKYFT